jgi:hypothetical protein
MTEQTKLVLYVVLLPFVISAAIEFLLPWVYWPIAILAGIVWLGSLGRLGSGDFEK